MWSHVFLEHSVVIPTGSACNTAKCARIPKVGPRSYTVTLCGWKR